MIDRMVWDWKHSDNVLKTNNPLAKQANAKRKQSMFRYYKEIFLLNRLTSDKPKSKLWYEIDLMLS